MLAGQGVKAVAVMWAMTFLSFILVPLRLYTRVYIIKAVGVDDHIFNLAWVFLLLYSIFITIAGMHGFGQPITALAIDAAVQAVYTEMIGQTFAVLGMAIAKLSLGFFLLRIVIEQWHRISIWISMVSLSLVSLVTAVIFWTQRLPSNSIYDPRVPGRTVVAVTPFSVLLGSWCAAVDFYFALLPWIFIWKLNMKFKEKMSIAISLSLGFVACVCGIIRTIELGGLSSANYTEDTVSLVIWSGVELAVTLICVGIPTVRPLYRTIVHGSNLEDSEGRYVKYDDSNQSSRFRMRNLAKDDTLFSVVQESNTESYITRDNQSDERILPGQYVDSHGAIRIRDEVRVERV
ncbi:hypothetical protein P170DRAFT_440925 [Aspergillus steynii IBT 23096]|uniref:Rhodopsin domain-containing protein n=1 Tax=Aspergillus steynii IBT 23096 TaxID=1392250 RepID=A0A2I2FS46_9EURO|nr:uncharacterized protein P170DRAFT_440925 [Aspergillus steynii IBT 23096]PLB43458.1 hypothetical protein P170DRAFT_440925 [Aspergillus steynii IBT 23096]